MSYFPYPLKSFKELTLEPKNENDYEVSKDNKLYFINKDKGILNLTLNNEKEKAIELYSFAKENEFKILKDKASQILNIKLKLKEKESIETSNKGNFNLEISNLLLLDSKGDDLNITNDYKLYLHNCENRRIYKNTSIQKNTDNTYRVNFSFDLIQDENSLFFKKATKLIVATQTLNDFSTKEIHSKANVAIISLSSKDKKERSYTFTPRVSAQEFKEEELGVRGEYLASNDEVLAYKIAFGEKKVRMLFYGGAKSIGDNAAFYYASLNVLNDYKKHYPNDIYIHRFVDSAKIIVDTINEQEVNSIASLDLFFHGSKWGLYIYKGSSMNKELFREDIEKHNLNAGLYAIKTADFFTATDGSEEKRTIYDIKFDKFISSGAVVEIHGCESGGDLYLVDSIVKNLSEEITDGYIVRHISKANPNIDGTKENKKQDYKHGLRAVWYNGKEIRKTTQERWIDFEELLK